MPNEVLFISVSSLLKHYPWRDSVSHFVPIDERDLSVTIKLSRWLSPDKAKTVTSNLPLPYYGLVLLQIVM